MADKTLADLPILPDYLSVEINGEKRDLFMSAAMLNTLARQCRDGLQSALQLSQDLYLQTTFMTFLLAPKDENNRPNIGNESSIFNPDSLEMTPATQEAILSWAGDHVRNFFWKGVLKQLNWLEENSPVLEELAKKKKTYENLLSGSPA